MSCVNCSRGFVGFMNLLMLLVALTVIGLTLWIRLDESFERLLREAILERNDQEPLRRLKIDMCTAITVCFWVIIGFAAACSILGFIGLLGSCCKSRCTMILYFVCMIVVILLEIACGIYVLVTSGNIKSTVTSYVSYSFSIPSTRDMYAITNRYNCCGVEGQLSINCYAGQKTCTAAVWDRLDLTLIIFGCSMIGVIVLQILTCLFTIPIFAKIKREETTF